MMGLLVNYLGHLNLVSSKKELREKEIIFYL
jgi:hypothetical protein